MTSHNLLVTVFTVSCVILSAASHDNTTTLTYPARVFTTTQGECPSDLQHEMVIAEVKEDIRNLLIREWLHLMCKLSNTDSIPYSGKFSLVQIFAEMRSYSPEEIFAVFIFAKRKRDALTTPLPDDDHNPTR